MYSLAKGQVPADEEIGSIGAGGCGGQVVKAGESILGTTAGIAGSEMAGNMKGIARHFGKTDSLSCQELMRSTPPSNLHHANLHSAKDGAIAHSYSL